MNSLMHGAMLALVALLMAACFGGVPGPGQTLAPGQTQVPGGPVAPGANTCNLITPAEMSAIWGMSVTAVGDSEGTCTWSNGMNTRFEATDLGTARAILGNDAEVTVAGRPGVIGTLFGVILYVQVGNVDLVVQTVMTTDDPATRQKVISTAEAMLT